ncbi:hypothetical protein BDR04DRAFT_1144226 [Suillus decipiens]|nr:hypothetical protein BDR04DRAFT_1144226 [Suillus decipiens]
MSNMITSGCYKICNVLYQDRYICYSGSNQFVGLDVDDTFIVEVLDEVQHIATLRNTKSDLYLALDMMETIVVGKTEPTPVQLSSEDGVKFVIHPRSVNAAAYLQDGDKWSLVAFGAPPTNDSKYWTFQTAN